MLVLLEYHQSNLKQQMKLQISTSLIYVSHNGNEPNELYHGQSKAITLIRWLHQT